ncbi:MAG: hypothetical protein IPM83_15505 [Ignavibacteria bacterium]|nr:hypothetical protein [Ignavibacteria bacterium]
MRTSLVQLLSWVICIGSVMPLAGSSAYAQTTGKTFGNDVSFVTPPNLRLLSNDSINGKPRSISSCW